MVDVQDFFLSNLRSSYFIQDEVLWGNNVQFFELKQWFLLQNDVVFEQIKIEWKLKFISFSQIFNNISFVRYFQKFR